MNTSTFAITTARNWARTTERARKATIGAKGKRLPYKAADRSGREAEIDDAPPF